MYINEIHNLTRLRMRICKISGVQRKEANQNFIYDFLTIIHVQSLRKATSELGRNEYHTII